MSRAVNEKGQVLEVVDLEVVGSDSKVVEFPLSDGSKVVIRITIRRAWRAQKEYTVTGEPLYGGDYSVDRGMRNIPQTLFASPKKLQAQKGDTGVEVG